MRKTVLNISDYTNFYKAILDGKTDDPIEKAIFVAYRDLCRTIRGFSKHKDHDRIYYTCVEVLQDEIKTLLNHSKPSQEYFDKWHKFACDRLKCFSEDILTYGQAQKWINMTLKYISIFEHKITEATYEYYHVPIDKYILKATNYKFDTAWSKINSYEKYMRFQKWFREKYNGIPLDEEFKLWLSEKR